MSGNTRSPGASVASRALAVLFAFDEQHRRLTLSDLARRADLPLATSTPTGRGARCKRCSRPAC